MAASLVGIEMQVLADEMPDASWLEDDRLAAYERGEFGFVGIRAVATIEIWTGPGYSITQDIESPGLWGIESDSSDEYLGSVYEDEKVILVDMLRELGVPVAAVVA